MSNSSLNLDMFTEVNTDYEVNQYKILAALKAIKEDFKGNKIFPHLSNLVELYSTLADIKKRLEDLRNDFPKRIKKIDFVNKVIEHEVVFMEDADLGRVEDLIEWALPLMQETIEEGKAIYDFVDEEIELEEVGIVPNYIEEGYFFVPDNEESKLLLYQYEVTVFESSQDKYRSLKTGLLKALETGLAHQSPNAIKLDLISNNKDLPNPATYSLNTELYFPFRETIFPVAKRKLMKQVS